MKKLTLLFLIIILNGTFAQSTKDIFQKAIHANDSGKYNTAIKLYTKVIQLDSNFKDVFLERGITYQSLNNHSNALNDFQAAFRKDSSLKALRFLIGSLHVNKKRKKAIELITKNLENFPNEAFLYARRGRLYAEINQNKKGRKDIDKALEIDSEYGYAYAMRAMFNYFDGKQSDACSDWQIAIFLGHDLNTPAVLKDCKAPYQQNFSDFFIPKVRDTMVFVFQYTDSIYEYEILYPSGECTHRALCNIRWDIGDFEATSKSKICVSDSSITITRRLANAKSIDSTIVFPNRIFKKNIENEFKWKQSFLGNEVNAWSELNYTYLQDTIGAYVLGNWTTGIIYESSLAVYYDIPKLGETKMLDETKGILYARGLGNVKMYNFTTKRIRILKRIIPIAEARKKIKKNKSTKKVDW